MTRSLKIATVLGALVLASTLAVQTGFARMVFFEIFAYVRGEDVVGTTILRNPPRNSPYERWMAQARKEIPVFEGVVLQDIQHIALEPWPALGEGVKGLYLRFSDYQMTDGRIVEIPAEGTTNSQRHLYEKSIYVLGGAGYTVLQQEGKPLQRVEWSEGDLFSVPLNVLHQHYAIGESPARLLMVTSFPLVLNLMNSEDFIDDADYAFTNRYDGESEYLDYRPGANELEANANFVEDVRSTPTYSDDWRGKGSKIIRFTSAGNSMLRMHVSEMPPRTHKKAHRHSSDAFILIIAGSGYSNAWRETAWDERIRVDWKPGTLFVPPIYWYHQHFNPASTPSRHLAVNVPDLVRNIGLHFGDQMEVDLPETREEWERELAKQTSER